MQAVMGIQFEDDLFAKDFQNLFNQMTPPGVLKMSGMKEVCTLDCVKNAKVSRPGGREVFLETRILLSDFMQLETNLKNYRK